MSTSVPTRPLLSVPEVAEQLNVSTRTVRRLIRRGELPVVHVGRQLRVDPDELRANIYADRSPLSIPDEAFELVRGYPSGAQESPEAAPARSREVDPARTGEAE